MYLIYGIIGGFLRWYMYRVA